MLNFGPNSNEKEKVLERQDRFHASLEVVEGRDCKETKTVVLMLHFGGPSYMVYKKRNTV